MSASRARTNRLTVIIVCSVLVPLGQRTMAQPYTILDLGTPGGDWECCAHALNEAGQVVGSGAPPSPSTPLPPQAFFWTSDAGMLDLGALGGYDDSNAMDINEAGRVLGWGDGGFFIWDSASGFTEIDLGTTHVSADAINDADQVVGGADFYAFLWQSGTGSMNLGTLGGASSQAHGINNAGQVVGGARLAGSPSYLHAFLITPDAGVWNRDDDDDGANDLMIDLGTLDGLEHSQAYDVNGAGRVVGASYNSSVETIRAFLWNGVSMEDLGTLGGQDSLALALNDRDQVVGHAETASGVDHAFVWKAGVMYDLNDLIPPGEDWTLLNAYDINNRGQIVGGGIHLVGGEEQDHAFLLTPVPCVGDLNEDGFRNIADFTLFAAAYGSRLGEPDYNPAADLNADGFVNATDFTLFAGVYAQPCP